MNSPGNSPISGLRDLFLGSEVGNRAGIDGAGHATAPVAPAAPSRPRAVRPATDPSSPAPTERRARSKPPSRKTSLNLPITLLERLETTRLEHRWTLPDLLRRGVEHPPSKPVAEEFWRDHRGQRASPRGLALDSKVDADLEKLSKLWRMSRSQVAAVVLTHTLATIDDGTIATA
jgi:hypothetical protein